MAAASAFEPSSQQEREHVPIIKPSISNSTKIKVKVFKDSAQQAQVDTSAALAQDHGNAQTLIDAPNDSLKLLGKTNKPSQLAVDTTITEELSSGSQSEYTKAKIEEKMSPDVSGKEEEEENES